MNKHLVIFLLFLNFYNASNAQLTIEYCQEKARNNYPQIQQFGLINQSETFNINNANKGYLPQININLQTSYQSDVTEIPPSLGNILSQMSGQDISFSTIPQNQYKTAIDINQIIWDGGQIRQQKESIKAITAIESEKIEIELHQIKERVNQLFFGILTINELIIQTELLEKELQTNYKKIQSYIVNGVANQSDADQIKVEQLKVNQRKVDLKANLNSYIEMLSILTGDSNMSKSTFVKPENLSTNYEGMVSQRNELKLFEAQNNLFSIQEKQIKSANTPRIGFFGQAGYSNPALNMFEPGFTPYYIVGARVSWNLSGFYHQKNNLAKININKQNNNIQKEVFILNTELKITQLQNEINKIRSQIATDEEIIKLRTSIKKVAESKVNNGTYTVTDLIREINAEHAAIIEKTLHEINLMLAIYTLKTTKNI